MLVGIGPGRNRPATMDTSIRAGSGRVGQPKSNAFGTVVLMGNISVRMTMNKGRR